MLSFSKYQGLGNDFLVIERPQLDIQLAVKLCNRRYGIGADGVLLTGIKNDRAFMHVINADGTHAEMCGNGIRCVALYLRTRGRRTSSFFDVDTDSGVHTVSILGPHVQVAMAIPRLDPASIPVRADQPLIDHPMRFGDHNLKVTAVSMGNPHAILFDVPESLHEELGPLIETDDQFPERTNVGFATLTKKMLSLRVWERGVGFTQACGTGACAAAVAAVESGRFPRHQTLHVDLPGGMLEIKVQHPGEPVVMTGPAVHVFDGQIQER